MKLLLIWLTVLSILYSTLGIVRHNHFQSGAFDLGIFDQAVWQYAHLQVPINTIKDRLILGDHLTLTLPLISPLFYIWDDVRILLIFQAFWVTFAAVAVYKIALGRKFSQRISLILSVIYSLFYGIQYLTYFDFHAVSIAVGIMPWLIFFFETQKIKSFIVSLIFLLLSQENMGLALSSLGLIYIFDKRRRKAAIYLFIGGILSTLIAMRVTSLFNSGSYDYTPAGFSLNPIEIIKRYFDADEKRLVWLYSFSGYSFLPLLSPGAVLAVAFDLAQYFLTGVSKARMWSPFLHHRAILDIFLLLGTLDVLSFLKNRKIDIEKVSIAALIMVFLMHYLLHLPLNKLSKSDFWKNESWMANDEKLIKSIPEDYSIATQDNLVPHMSHRKEIRLVYPKSLDFDNNFCGKKSCWWLEFSGKPNFLVVDRRPNQWLTQILTTNENYQSAIDNMVKTGKIKYVKNVGDAYLYKIVYKF